jgi:hypothetical protein
MNGQYNYPLDTSINNLNNIIDIKSGNYEM